MINFNSQHLFSVIIIFVFVTFVLIAWYLSSDEQPVEQKKKSQEIGEYRKLGIFTLLILNIKKFLGKK